MSEFDRWIEEQDKLRDWDDMTPTEQMTLAWNAGRKVAEAELASAERQRNAAEAAQATLKAENNRLRDDTCAQTIAKLRVELAALKKLIDESDLEPVECGGLCCGDYVQPKVMRLLSKRRKVEAEDRTATLQKLASFARKNASLENELAASRTDTKRLDEEDEIDSESFDDQEPDIPHDCERAGKQQLKEPTP